MTEATTLRVALSDAVHHGQGESEPHESDAVVRDEVERQVRAATGVLSPDMPLEELREVLPLPTARNAVDCALWDLRAKRTGTPAWTLANVGPPRPLVTAVTIGIDAPEEMAEHAHSVRHCPLIKMKLSGSDQEIARVEAVRAVVPHAQLIVDANEAWSFRQLVELAPHLAKLRVSLIEQPLPAGRDDELIGFRSPVPLCADEACQDLTSLERVSARYQFINVKLDKTGGLTEALRLVRAARRLGLGVMTGCNVGTSLAMAPALLVGMLSDFVDVDGASMLVEDRASPLRYDLHRGLVHPPARDLWG